MLKEKKMLPPKNIPVHNTYFLDPGQLRQTADEATESEGKVEGFADDTSVLAKAEETALLAIKENLLNFELFSGLKVNFDKCVILVMGCGNVIPDFILNSGFQVSNHVTILGMEIFNDTVNLYRNFDRVITQIINIRNFWTRFNLSMPGRLAVAKTLMLSRLGYLGCIIDPDPVQLGEIEKIIYTFVKGKLTVSEKRINVKPDTGGLGMINISEYLTALKSSWIVRAKKNNSDHWSSVLHTTGIVNLDTYGDFGTGTVLDGCPILSTILKAVKITHVQCIKSNNNILDSIVIKNPVLSNNNKLSQINLAFLTACNLSPADARNLKVSSFLDTETLVLKPKANLNLELSANITDEAYSDLKTMVKELFKVKLLVHGITSKPASFGSICNKIKKGSKTFRIILGISSNPPKPMNYNSIRKFCSLTNIQFNNSIPVRQINTIWQCWGLSNKIKEFSFKFFNNLLGINSRLGHFVANINEGCTFCTIRSVLPVHRETFKHLFFDCPETDKTLKGFEDKYFNFINTSDERLTFWFLGSIKTNPKFENNLFLRMTMIVIQFFIWECKLNKRVQSLSSCLNFYFYHMEILRKVNKKLQYNMGKTDLDLCRYWNSERGRGW
jgi:hypothetical protein